MRKFFETGEIRLARSHELGKVLNARRAMHSCTQATQTSGGSVRDAAAEWADEEYEKLMALVPVAAPPPSAVPVEYAAYKRKREQEMNFRQWVLYIHPLEELDSDEMRRDVGTQYDANHLQVRETARMDAEEAACARRREDHARREIKKKAWDAEERAQKKAEKHAKSASSLTHGEEGHMAIVNFPPRRRPKEEAAAPAAEEEAAAPIAEEVDAPFAEEGAAQAAEEAAAPAANITAGVEQQINSESEEERVRRETKQRERKEAKERARKDAEEEAKQEERARKEAEERAKREAEEQATKNPLSIVSRIMVSKTFRQKMLKVRKDYMASKRAAVERLIEETGITGGMEFYSDNKQLHRDALRWDPLIAAWLEVWYKCVANKFDDNDDGVLTFDEYSSFHRLLVDNYGSDDVEEVDVKEADKLRGQWLREDWENDSHGDGSITKEELKESIFELMDLNCQTDQLPEYVHWLETECNTLFGPTPPPIIRVTQAQLAANTPKAVNSVVRKRKINLPKTIRRAATVRTLVSIDVKTPSQGETEEEATKRAEEQYMREAEEAKRVAQELARETEAQAEMEAEERARKEAEDRARDETEQERQERIQRQAEQQEKREAEEQGKREAEEQARREAEEQVIREVDEQMRRRAEEEKARKEAEERARMEVQECASSGTDEEQARKEAAERAKKAEERAKREAEEKAKREAEERARKEAEERAKPEGNSALLSLGIARPRRWSQIARKNVRLVIDANRVAMRNLVKVESKSEMTVASTPEVLNSLLRRSLGIFFALVAIQSVIRCKLAQQRVAEKRMERQQRLEAAMAQEEPEPSTVQRTVSPEKSATGQFMIEGHAVTNSAIRTTPKSKSGTEKPSSVIWAPSAHGGAVIAAPSKRVDSTMAFAPLVCVDERAAYRTTRIAPESASSAAHNASISPVGSVEQDVHVARPISTFGMQMERRRQESIKKLLAPQESPYAARSAARSVQKKKRKRQRAKKQKLSEQPVPQQPVLPGSDRAFLGPVPCARKPAPQAGELGAAGTNVASTAGTNGVEEQQSLQQQSKLPKGLHSRPGFGPAAPETNRVPIAADLQPPLAGKGRMFRPHVIEFDGRPTPPTTKKRRPTKKQPTRHLSMPAVVVTTSTAEFYAQNHQITAREHFGGPEHPLTSVPVAVAAHPALTCKPHQRSRRARQRGLLVRHNAISGSEQAPPNAAQAPRVP
jgi:hypothetical protein